MPNSKPILDVWDSCCLIGILNEERDKLSALLAQTYFFETGAALLGLPLAVLDEVVTLSDGTSAEKKVKEFLQNPYVQILNPTLEISFKSKSLRMRFDSKNMPDLPDKAIAAGVSKQQANRLGVKDSEILATALIYEANRLTTYDPFLLFIGREYLGKGTALLVDRPAPTLLPFPEAEEKGPNA